MKRFLLLLIASSTFTIISASAHAKNAKCFYEVEGDTLLNDTCIFTPTGEGSFVLSGKSLSKSKDLSADKIYLNVVKPDVAGLSFTKGKKVTNDGVYLRDENDSACWESAEYPARLCVW